MNKIIGSLEWFNQEIPTDNTLSLSSNNVWEEIHTVLSAEHKEVTREWLIEEKLKNFMGTPPVWTVSKQLREKYKKNRWENQVLRTKMIDDKPFTSEVDYIAEKDASDCDVYKTIVNEKTIEQKYKEFWEVMKVFFGEEDWEKFINTPDIGETIHKKDIVTLYNLLEKSWFPKGHTNNYGNLQYKNGFAIRVFRPDGLSTVMLVDKNKINFNHYDERYWYVPIGLPAHSKK